MSARFWYGRVGGACMIALLASASAQNVAWAEQIPVRHIEGVTMGFLVVRTLDGTAVAYGDLKQIVKESRVRADMTLHFRDGSYYQENTIYTQEKEFRLLSDHVIRHGPSFKEQLESWVNASTGDILIHYEAEGKQKQVSKHLDVPADVCNGMIFILLKNVDPAAPKTALSMVVTSSSPRVVTLNVFPEPEKTANVGFVPYKAQHYRIHVEIGGVTGVVAPLVGKQPPDLQAWLVKSEAPTFLEFEGPLESQGTVWRMELAAPNPATAEPPRNAK